MSDLVRVPYFGPQGELMVADVAPGEVVTLETYNGSRYALVVESTPSRYAARSQCFVCGARSCVPKRLYHLAEELLPHADDCAFAAHMKQERV